MTDELRQHYEAFYQDRAPTHVYPVEFVVRAFLGNYPQHKSDPASYASSSILDLGFGDGRNMPLLHNLGMKIFGVEISQDICNLTQMRMERLGIEVTLHVGRNSSIPHPDAFFDAVLACHACYYVDPGLTFRDNILEIARVLKPTGTFVFSAPKATSYILRGAIDLGDGHMEIANDPYGIRNGSILKKFDCEADIVSALTPLFEGYAIGSCENDFWGIQEHVWIVVCSKAREKA